MEIESLAGPSDNGEDLTMGEGTEVYHMSDPEQEEAEAMGYRFLPMRPRS